MILPPSSTSNLSHSDSVMIMKSKYVGGLDGSIQKELKPFKVENINWARMKIMRFKEKNWSREDTKGDMYNKGGGKLD